MILFQEISINKGKKNPTTDNGRGVLRRRLSLIFILFLVPLAMLVSLISPATTYAAKLSENSSLADQALAYTTYWSMVDCLAQEKQQIDDAGFGFSGFRISEDHARSGDWWMTEGNLPRGTTQGAESPGSYLNSKVKKESGNALCNDILKTLGGLLGYTDYLEFICTFVKFRANNSSCATGTGDFGGIANSIDTFKSVVNVKLWPNGVPGLTVTPEDWDAGLYLLYREAFLKGCSPVVSSSPGKDFAYKNIQIINNDGTRTTKTYEGVNRGDSRAIYREGGNTISANCGSIADKVNELAPKFSAYLIAHPNIPVSDNEEVDGCGDDDTSNDPPGGCSPQQTGTSCPIEGIGWMVCPLLNALGGVSDAMLGWISDILTLKPLSVTTQAGDDSAQYTAWNSIRNIANVVLVIGFIIIIFSQLTGIGVSNYGVKKTLPRLIIVAILINLSFYVMALAIDLTNIIGTGISSLFAAITPDMAAAGFSVENIVGSFLTGSTLVLAGATISAGVIASGAIPLSALALMAFPIVATAALGLFAAFATLFIRNALIVVLVVISPLAIAAYLLPNTQDLFTRWRKLFVSMLVLFPMAALLFAGAKFAAYVSVASEQPLSALVALFIMAAPLGMLPFLIRSSNSLLSNIGGKLGNLARSARNPLNKSVSGMVDRQRAGYKAGERGFFGRRQKAGRTNFAQRMNNRRMTREQETKNLQGEATENWREAGLTGNGRSAQKAARALDNEKTLSTRKGALDNEYTARSDARRNTAGTQDHLYNARAENAALESETHRAELEQARTQRIATNPNLANLDTRLRAAKVETARNEAGRKAQFDQHVQGSQALTEAVQATKAAEETSKTIQMEQDTTFQGALQSDPTLLDLRNRQSAAKLETEALQAEGAAATAKIAATDDTLRSFEERKADANLQSAAVAASSEAETAIRQSTDDELKNIKLDTEASKKQKSLADAQFGQVVAEASTDAGREQLLQEGFEGATLDTLRDTQLQSSVTASATDSAQRIQQKEYAEELKASSPLAQQAGGIDPYGASRVTAAASSLLTETVNKAIASERSTMTTTPVGTGQPGDEGLMSIVQNTIGPPQTAERRAAAVAQILKVGKDEDIHTVLDYVQDPANFTSHDDQVLLQQQIASDLGSRKPTSLGAGDIAALARGEYEGVFDKKVVDRITGGKVSADTLTATSADELTRIIAAINRGAQGKPNGINPNDPNLAALRAQIDTFFKNENSKLPPPEIVEYMKTIQGPPTP